MNPWLEGTISVLNTNEKGVITWGRRFQFFYFLHPFLLFGLLKFTTFLVLANSLHSFWSFVTWIKHQDYVEKNPHCFYRNNIVWTGALICSYIEWQLVNMFVHWTESAATTACRCWQCINDAGLKVMSGFSLEQSNSRAKHCSPMLRDWKIRNVKHALLTVTRRESSIFNFQMQLCLNGRK